MAGEFQQGGSEFALGSRLNVACQEGSGGECEEEALEELATPAAATPLFRRGSTAQESLSDLRLLHELSEALWQIPVLRPAPELRSPKRRRRRRSTRRTNAKRRRRRMPQQPKTNLLV